MSYPQQPGQYPGEQPGQYPPPQPGQYPQQPGGYPQQPGGYPQQSGGYPQQPGGYPQQSGPMPQQPGQYPGAPGAMPPFPGGNEIAREPSKGTAIAAAILAILGTLWALTFAIVNFGQTSTASSLGLDLEWLVWTQATAYAIEVLTLGPGAALLFMRKDAGRWLVAAGSAVHIIQGIIATVVLLDIAAGMSDNPAASVGGGVGGVLVVLSPAIATIILVLLPPTGRWLNWNKRQPPQGMPQQW